MYKRRRTTRGGHHRTNSLKLPYLFIERTVTAKDLRTYVGIYYSYYKPLIIGWNK